MNKRKLNIIGIIVFLLIIITLIVKNVLDKKSLDETSKFTIGVVKSIEPNTRSGYRIYFYYYVKGKKYEAFDGIYKMNKSLLGKHFYVRFSTINPSNCELLLDLPVRDVKNSPPDGWKKIPE